jgi:hypothetical protein
LPECGNGAFAFECGELSQIVRNSNNFDAGEQFSTTLPVELWANLVGRYCLIDSASRAAPCHDHFDAVLELGFLYLDRNRIDEAPPEQCKLRSLNATYASELLAQISRYKTALVH